MNKGKIWIGLSVAAVFTAAAAAAGMYLGSMIYRTWLGLKTEPSVGMLWKYWQHIDRLPENMVFPLKAASVVAGLVPLLALAVILFTLFSKPKRELHGSARFANRREIKKLGLLKEKFNPDEDPDLLIGKYGDSYLRWGGNEFLYLAAPTRSGKGVGLVIPNCLYYRHSMVVFDPKLENFLISGGFRAKYQDVFLFNPAGTTPEHTRNPGAPLVSHRWNPLTYIRRHPAFAYKDIKSIAQIMYPRSQKSNDNSAFFQESAQNLFAGLLLYMIETEDEKDLSLPENRTTMANLFRLTAPDDGSTLGEWLKKEIELRDMQPKTRLSENCKKLLLGFANGNAKTGADVLSTLTAPLSIFIDPVVEAATSGDDFFLDDVRKKCMTIYIGIVPTETGVFSRLTNLFFSQLINVNVQQGLPADNKSALPYQCCLMMDEFTALGVIPAVQHGVAYIAGYGLRLVLIFQTPSQVADLYGKEAMRTFFTNFACQIVFPPREQNDAKEYSELIGYYTYKAKSTSRSSGKGRSTGSSISDQRRALMNPDELKMMPKEDCIISLNNSRPIHAQKIVYYNDPQLSGRANHELPYVPVLDVRLHTKAAAAASAAKAEYIDPEKLDGFAWQDAANAEEIAKTLITALVPPDSKPEYVAQLVPAIARNWGGDSLPVIAAILKDTGVSTAKLPDAV